ncbi:MAG: hypothetical protein KatS3mg009_1689 [Acidimicrobiia bacterium]|nr:MAG: hypothetical protein KatS3mg009_1689 [Acidimicrobiia bacterium]
MIRLSEFATKCFAIDTSLLKSSLRSILYAACSTMSLHWYSSIADSAIIHWIALLLGEARSRARTA